MWMKVTVLLTGFLVWDYTTAEDAESAVERAGGKLMAIEPVAEFVDYVKRGDLADDVSATALNVYGEVTASFAGTEEATAEPVVAAADPAAHRGLSADEIKSIAQALAELQQAARAEARAERRAAAAQMEPIEDEAPVETAEVAEEPAAESGEAADELADAGAETAAPGEAEAETETGTGTETAAAEEAAEVEVAEADPALVERTIDELGPDLLSAIISASQETGANSGYLLHIAMRESGLVLTAQAPTSSANGPFQFIRQTWYQMMGEHGAKHGYDEEVKLLTARNGRFSPVSAEAESKLLALRSDPYAAALMAAELTLSNKRALESRLGRPPAHGELYAAHVFGAGGAAKLIETRERSASTTAAAILPSAAASNRWLFYDRSGQPVTVAGLFDELSRFMSTREVAQVCRADLNFVAGI
ncbi:hypothetical protein ACSHT0_10900 [Tepidicaulis sp. LMO-SS28]|uniref:hypothetical protein n=1 Tax=Tepidicaulis sp. LMO-SS28 TaxID=3447455 RepID=UPI003EDF4B7E